MTSRRSAAVLLAIIGAAAAACRAPAVDPTATRAVFLETCAPGSLAVEVSVCECAFDRIVQDLDDAELARLDRQLRDDPDDVPPVVAEAALGCASDLLNPGVPTSRQPAPR